MATVNVTEMPDRRLRAEDLIEGEFYISAAYSKHSNVYIAVEGRIVCLGEGYHTWTFDDWRELAGERSFLPAPPGTTITI